jgi:HPt (histidine-containing phosphotransfer) domain-containing protein
MQGAIPEETPQQDILSRLQGFDTKAGLSNVAGNRDLYLRLLDRFANNYRHSGTELRDALKRMEHDASAHEEAMRLAHTAKGVAANLGAHTLAAIAGELESAIKKNRVRGEMLARYDLLLGEALGAIDGLPKRDDARVGQKAISAADKECIATVLNVLPDLMETDWYGAQQRLQSLVPLVEDTVVSAHFREITMALEEFDSAGVAERSKRLLDAI